MTNLLWFDWEKDRDGYRLLTFDPKGLSWEMDGPDYNVAVPSGCSDETAVLLRKYGMTLYGLEEPITVLEPMGDDSVISRPLEQNPAIFREFAELSLQPEEIRKFADQYGLLSKPAGGPSQVENWYRQIKEMRNAIRGLEKSTERGSLRAWADRFNKEIYRGSGPDRRVSMSAKLRRTDEPLRPTLHVVPDDLISAMWLRLAQHVSSSERMQSCNLCSKWFVFGTGTGRRSSAQYCSDRCRKAFNKRQRRSA